MSANWLYYPFVLLLLALSFAAQEFVPAFEFAQQARFLLPPVVFFSSALSVSFPMMLVMAFFTGLVWDARNLPYKEDKAPAIVMTSDAALGADVEKHPEVGGSLPFGYTIFVFGALGTLMQGVRPLFKRGRWELPVLMVGVAIMAWLLVEYLLMSFLRGSFVFPYGMWTKLITDTLLAMLVSPVLLYLLHSVAHKMRFEAPQEGLTFHFHHGS
jgi:hypothetical protein